MSAMHTYSICKYYEAEGAFVPVTSVVETAHTTALDKYLSMNQDKLDLPTPVRYGVQRRTFDTPTRMVLFTVSGPNKVPKHNFDVKKNVSW